MASVVQSKKTLKELGWEQVTEVPESVWERLESESGHQRTHNTNSVLKYTSCFYEVLHKEDQYIVVTDGADFVTVNAEIMVCVSADSENGRPNTSFFTIGGSDETVFEWIAWAAKGCDVESRPGRGFNYVS